MVWVEQQKSVMIGLGWDLTMFKPWRIYGRMDLETGAYRKVWEADDPNVPAGQYGAYEESLKHGTNIFASLFVSYDLPKNWVIGADFVFDIRFGDERLAAVPNSQTYDTRYARGGEFDPTLEVTVLNGELNNYLDLGFGVWARWNVAGGDIRVAVTMKLPDVWNHGHDGAKPQLFFPIMFNYSF
ncbi:hypothetical protein FACS189473_0840 [Spirochaetia bacterium]|nr:hypothetical protein FACS189473_0840 [Spirochaetia bacterium]